MDEFRPFPAEQPVDPPDEETSDHEPVEEPSVSAERAFDGATSEGPMEGEQPERAAPDTEHPGGHLHGTVARLNRPRRFGFLRADDGAEIFFHASALDTGPSSFDALRPGQEAEFDCHQDEQGRGLAASLVTPIGEPPPEPPRQPRPPRPERVERPERGPRGGRGAMGVDKWHVTVLRERYDSPLHSQLERLLNERNLKPGSFTVSFARTDDGAECWVAYYTGDEGKR